MNIVILDPAEIHIGQPLKWDIFDSTGDLLFKKGAVIETIEKLNKLADNGIFVEAKDAPQKAAQKERVVVHEQQSVIQKLNDVGHRLGRLMYSLHLQNNAESSIMELVQEVMSATNLNQDIALASTFLNHATADYAIRNSLNVAVTCILVAQAMKKPPEEIASLVAAALTMNVGMLRQQNEYQTRTTPLTPKELEAIHQHPVESVNILKKAGVTNQEWLSYVLHHHECEDGSGYPSGKTADAIPAYAKILALSDMFCGWVAGRANRKPMLPNLALRNIFAADQKRGSKSFAPFFIGAIGLYPIGSLVKLQNGEYAVVTKRGESPQTPCVHAYIGTTRAPLSVPIMRETGNPKYAITQAASAEDAPLRFSMQRIWGNEALA